MKTKEITSTLRAALETEDGKKVLLQAMNKMFESGAWEIPDDAVAGHVATKVQQLEAQVEALTDELARQAALRTGAPVKGARVDAFAESAVDSKRKKTGAKK